jgi:undecaprenyl diphosphate synthase
MQAQGLEPNEDNVSKCLLTAKYPDPDLIIRTGGEYRISNYFLWQAAYSEFYVSNSYWPDFTKEEFLAAIENYKQRDRRFGGVKK